MHTNNFLSVKSYCCVCAPRLVEFTPRTFFGNSIVLCFDIACNCSKISFCQFKKFTFVGCILQKFILTTRAAHSHKVYCILACVHHMHGEKVLTFHILIQWFRCDDYLCKSPYVSPTIFQWFSEQMQ